MSSLHRIRILVLFLYLAVGEQRFLLFGIRGIDNRNLAWLRFLVVDDGLPDFQPEVVGDTRTVASTLEALRAGL